MGHFVPHLLLLRVFSFTRLPNTDFFPSISSERPSVVFSGSVFPGYVFMADSSLSQIEQKPQPGLVPHTRVPLTSALFLPADGSVPDNGSTPYELQLHRESGSGQKDEQPKQLSWKGGLLKGDGGNLQEKIFLRIRRSPAWLLQPRHPSEAQWALGKALEQDVLVSLLHAGAFHADFMGLVHSRLWVSCSALWPPSLHDLTACLLRAILSHVWIFFRGKKFSGFHIQIPGE